MSGRRWTQEDQTILEDGMYRRPITAIAKQLGRTPSACYLMAYKLGLPRRDPGVLSCNELSMLLGLDGHVVVRWLKLGEIPCKHEPGRGAHGEYHIRDEDVIAWLRAKPWMVDRDNVEPSYRGFIHERYITLAEAFRRGAAHASALGQAAYCGLIPGQRKRGLFWVIPESSLPLLIEGRRMTVDDASHRRQLIRWERTQRIGEARRRPGRKAA